MLNEDSEQTFQMLNRRVGFLVKNCKRRGGNLGFGGRFVVEWRAILGCLIAKDICFGLQKTRFWRAKDGLLAGESLAFASERYTFRK